MGLISEIANSRRKNLPTGRLGENIWSRVFGENRRESSPPRVRPSRGTGYGVSAISAPATGRLLQSLRSMAPGSWSDDRWEQSRHQYGIVSVGVGVYCRQMSQSVFKVYRKDLKHHDGKRPVTPQDPPEGDRMVKPYDLVKLLERPNNQDSFGRFMYRIGQQKKLTGTGLVWMVPNKFGAPYELYPIPTALAIPQPAINPEYPDGYYRIQPIYPYGPFSSYPTPSTAVGAAIPAQWMLRFLDPHPFLRYDGWSTLTAMRMEVDQFEAIERARWYTMKRLVNPGAILNPDGSEGSQPLPEEEQERIRSEFENETAGTENSGRLFISAPGYKLEPWSNSLKDLEFKEGFNQMADFILGGGFGVTKEAAGMITTSNYATLWASLKQLHHLTLKPDCDSVAHDLTHYLAPFFGDDLIVEIETPRIDDEEIKLGRLNMAIQARAITKNQVLKTLEFPTTKEPWGEDIAGTEPTPQAGELGMAGSQQLPGQIMSGQPPSMPPGGDLNGQPEKQAAEMEAERPSPGGMAEGALGPRKRFGTNFKTKRFPLRKLVVSPKTEDYYAKIFLQHLEPSINGNH